MKYRELQSILKAFRESGYQLRCKLNQKAEVLAAEYDRITRLINTQHGVTGTDLSLDNLAIVSEADIPINSYQTKIPKFNQRLNGGVRHIGIEFEYISKLRVGEVVEILQSHGYPVTYEGYTHRVVAGHYKIVDDSSIDKQGEYKYTGELVTPPLDMTNPRDMNTLKGILKVMRDECHCRVNKSCGTHVHLEAKDFNAQQIINYFKAWQSNEWFFDSLMKAPSRKGNMNNFCKSLAYYDFNSCRSLTDLCRVLGNGDLSISARYHKLNPYSFAKYGTIEVRHHSATLNFDKIISYAKEQMIFMVNSI